MSTDELHERIYAPYRSRRRSQRSRSTRTASSSSDAVPLPSESRLRCDRACLYSSTMRQRSDLDSVVETILVDAYGDDEQYVAFLTVIEEETRLPAAATLLGAPVTVTGLDYTNEARGLVAICKGSNGTGEVALADLAFPPDTVTAWIPRRVSPLPRSPAVPGP